VPSLLQKSTSMRHPTTKLNFVVRRTGRLSISFAAKQALGWNDSGESIDDEPLFWTSATMAALLYPLGADCGMSWRGSSCGEGIVIALIAPELAGGGAKAWLKACHPTRRPLARTRSPRSDIPLAVGGSRQTRGRAFRYCHGWRVTCQYLSLATS